MGSKPDFTQKLLNDLRLRKQRMAGGHTSDANKGSSRGNFRQTKGAKPIQTIGQKNGNTHRSYTVNHTTTQERTNQIVPYGGDHHAAQKGDIANFAMAIACAFDNGGNLKAFELKSNAAMMNLLQQISKRSAQTSNMQLQSANQFPTLTHLHIDEIAKGAQKLDQILKACTNGLNIEKGGVEAGKELWKGAMDLEQSLRMLVSLQEASNSMVNVKPQRKSRIKLLEEGEESDDDKGMDLVKPKQVERPVFSFDKRSKSTMKGDPAIKPDNQGDVITKGVHRRSASCGPEFQPSESTISLKPKQNTARLPNVIAKLMGLEEIPQNAEPKPAMEVRTWPRSSELALRTSHRSSKSTEFKAKDAKNVSIQVNQNRIDSTNIAIVTDNYYDRTKLDTQKNDRKGERAEIGNCVNDAQDAIYKVNELQSQMMNPRSEAAHPRNIDSEARVATTITQKQGVKHTTDSLQRTVEIQKRGSEAPHKMQAVSTGTCDTQEAGDSVANKLSINKQKKKMPIQLKPEMLPNFEPQGKKLKTENIMRHTANNKFQQRKKAAHLPKQNNLQTATSDPKNMQRQQNVKQDSADGGCATSNATDGASRNSYIKEKSLISLKSGQNGPVTDGETDSQACTELKIDADLASVSKKKVTEKMTAQRRDPNIISAKTNDLMAKTAKTATKKFERKKPLKPIFHQQKPKRLEKITVSEAVLRGRTSKSTEDATEPCDSAKQEQRQEAEFEHMSTKSKPKGDESYSTKDHEEASKYELPPCNKSEYTALKAADSPELATEVHKAKPPKIATDGDKDETCTSNSPQKQHRYSAEVKQEPLTDDEINLKQKLIQSHLFLNTAEALFKLRIPIGILNYASDQINHDKNNKLILDCGFELLKKKGRRKEMSLYPSIGKVMKCNKVRSLDNLVRQMHEDFDTLRTYGRDGTDEYDEVEYLLKMLERDIFYKTPDLNCMWDLGWKEKIFAYNDVDEVIKDVEQFLLDELLGELVADWL